MFRLNSAGQLGVGERCVNADSQGVKLVVCRLGTVDGPWEYDEVKKKKEKKKKKGKKRIRKRKKTEARNEAYI